MTTRADGLSVPGARVSVVGSADTVTTDATGHYSLPVPRSLVRGDRMQVKVDALGLPAKVTDVVVTGAGRHGGRRAEPRLHRAGDGRVARRRRRGREGGAGRRDHAARRSPSSGYTETAQVIQSLAPSFNFPRPTITDGTDTVRPATLRGLGPDQVLVLVNGKRRHQSALVHLNGSIGRGSTGVDLNAIPVSAIDHIEVLRDGAAAQYGSDAIAGVINIVLKGGASRPERDLEVRPVDRDRSPATAARRTA